MIFKNEQKLNTLNQIMSSDELFKTGQENIVIIGDYTYCFHAYAPYQNYFNLFITDITNAGKVGKTCGQIKLVFDINSSFTNKLLNSDFDDLFFHLVVDDEIEGVSEKYVIRLDAKRVYNPLTLKEVYKPLKEEPKKWTVKHVIKALVNGQFIDLKCDGKYTDDYAYDNDVNFQKGALKAKDFVKDLICNACYGWRAYKSDYDNRINVNCHNFDYNSFKFVLNSV